MSKKLMQQSVWHEGEIFLQDKVGVTKRMAEVGQRVIRDYMPKQHRDFYVQLPFIVIGSISPTGDAWATFLEGAPGFITSPTPTRLAMAASLTGEDPAAEGMRDGASIGLLGIELHTRRRNRMNGTLLQAEGGLQVEVDQSFGNCPRYIQLRDFTFTREPGSHSGGAVETLPGLDAEARAIIQAADAFFVASWAEREGKPQADVSHRGGKPGFIRVSDDGTLTIPDFNGNLFFSTLGNILLNGQAGLLFVDFNTGDMLQMTGEAKVVLDSPEIAAFQGAERLWTFAARRVVRRRNALALRWKFAAEGPSPHSLMTGSWQEAANRIKAAELATRWRPFRVVKITDESRSIRSFYLQPGDGAGMLPHLAGQHLPVRVKILNAERPVIRTYTLSSAPSDGFYRISVKRDGSVSRHLHNDVSVGDIIEALAPAGDFTLDAHEQRPAVLLAGGVGITPMLAMLRHIVYEGLRKQRVRQTFLFQSSRHAEDLPFTQEINELVAAAKGAVQAIRVLSQPEGAQLGVDYDVRGHIDMPLLTRRLPFNDYDFYLCGPAAFTQSLYDGLRQYNIRDARIHTEAFGPSSLVRPPDSETPKSDALLPSTSPVPIAFMRSLKEARWMPDSGSLLELAEARGLNPEFSCREGASCWNDYVLQPELTPLQDTNDNFLGNIQKDGTYSVIPRSAGGEITPEGLMEVGRIAREYNLYTKITGSQRIGLFGAQKDDLPEIWRQLIEAGFETGHAYAKALRMAKTCVGSTWCRYGVGDSVGFGVELENRYKGIRTPHKMKFGVSGCTRECAEAQGKDVGIIATEKGWNLYVCGNGGMKPRHADLLAADLDHDTIIKYLDRFMMFYIRTADKLTRTAVWLENLEGGIDYLRSVIIDDKLGLNDHLAAELNRLREKVICEWTETVSTPQAQVRFKHFINSPQRDPNVQIVSEREQHRPATPHERIPVTLVEVEEHA